MFPYSELNKHIDWQNLMCFQRLWLRMFGFPYHAALGWAHHKESEELWWCWKGQPPGKSHCWSIDVHISSSWVGICKWWAKGFRPLRISEYSCRCSPTGHQCSETGRSTSYCMWTWRRRLDCLKNNWNQLQQLQRIEVQILAIDEMQIRFYITKTLKCFMINEQFADLLT